MIDLGTLRSMGPPSTPLGLDGDELATCVACGLCLPHCPTFRVTGSEALSPRGRIDAMRSVESGRRPIDETFIGFMETCVQCRGCEPACPSGVPFGRLMEGTRAAIAERTTPGWLRIGLRLLRFHRLLLVGGTLTALGQRLRIVPRSIPRLPVRRGRRLRSMPSSPDDLWLMTGCVMDVAQRPVHRAVVDVAEILGETVTARSGGCCGALQVHAGLLDDARRSARHLMDAFPGDRPILVDSAGCGAAMKDYGHLLGTDEARHFAARVVDVHEWLAGRLETLPAPRRRPAVIVQDPCHLRHVQGLAGEMRRVLERVATVIELDDEGLCCGAGGAYSLVEADLATAIGSRKRQAIDRARARHGAEIIVSANPGCAFHLGRDRELVIRHPIELVRDAVSGRDEPG